MSHSHSITDYPGQIVGIAAISAAVGAVTAMMLSPRSGQQIRSGIKNRAVDMKDRLGRTQSDMSDSLENAQDRLADTFDKVKTDAKATKDEMKDATKK